MAVAIPPFYFMTKYRVIKSFRGSKNGIKILSFEAGQSVDIDLIGDELLAIGIKERWLEPDKEDKPKPRRAIRKSK